MQCVNRAIRISNQGRAQKPNWGCHCVGNQSCFCFTITDCRAHERGYQVWVYQLGKYAKHLLTRTDIMDFEVLE